MRVLGERGMGKACLLWLQALFTIALLATLTERAKAGPRGEHLMMMTTSITTNVLKCYHNFITDIINAFCESQQSFVDWLG